MESAIAKVLDEGYRTADIAPENCSKVVSTTEIGSLVSGYAVESANITQAFHAV